MKLKFWFQRALFTLFGGIGVGLLMVAVTVIQVTGERMSSFWTRMPAFLLLGSGYFLLIMMMKTVFHIRQEKSFLSPGKTR